MDTGVVGQTGDTAMLNVMTVKEHDSGSATILSQNMVGNIVSENPRKKTSVRLGDAHLVRNYCALNLGNLKKEILLLLLFLVVPSGS